MSLLISSHKCGRCLVVTGRGNVGADTAGLLDAELRAALDRDLLLIAVNLAEAVLADASALEVLTGIHRRAALGGKVFLVVAPDPQAYETMRCTGLDRSLLVFAAVADFNAWNGGPCTHSDCGGVPHVRISLSECASRYSAAHGSPPSASASSPPSGRPGWPEVGRVVGEHGGFGAAVNSDDLAGDVAGRG